MITLDQKCDADRKLSTLSSSKLLSKVCQAIFYTSYQLSHFTDIFEAVSDTILDKKAEFSTYRPLSLSVIRGAQKILTPIRKPFKSTSF